MSKLLEDDIAGLWPTDRAKVKAEIRGWLDDSPEEQQHAPTEKDLTVMEKTGSSTFEIVSGRPTLLFPFDFGMILMTNGFSGAQ